MTVKSWGTTLIVLADMGLWPPSMGQLIWISVFCRCRGPVGRAPREPPPPQRIILGVVNAGKVDRPRLATVVGTQTVGILRQMEVYRSSLMVSSPVGSGVTLWTFPAFVQNDKGPDFVDGDD